jgi:valyl-tRNA synthetase
MGGQARGIPCYRLMDGKGHMREDGLPYAEAAAVAQEVAEGKRTLSEAEADLLNLVPDHLRGLDRFAARWQVTSEIFDEGLAVMTRADDPVLGATALAHGEEARTRWCRWSRTRSSPSPSATAPRS